MGPDTVPSVPPSCRERAERAECVLGTDCAYLVAVIGFVRSVGWLAGV